MNATVRRGGSLSALLVGIDGDLATACTLVLPDVLRANAREAIDDRAIAVGARSS